MSQGLFITFEGTEGSGKSTQIQELKTRLDAHQIPSITTKEPGGTSHGKQIRSMILDPYTHFQSRYTELMLFYADRFEHIDAVIKPALAQNKVVICDRYVDSTIAYQIGGRKMPKDLITAINQYVSIMPKLTFLLNIDPKEGLNRAQKRAALDRFEQEDITFHTRVKATYLNQAQNNPDRIISIDTTNQTIQTIHTQIWKTLTPHLNLYKQKKETSS